MTSCTSTFGEADYGCVEQGLLTAAFEVAPASFSHDPNIPNQAVLTFNVNSALTVSNINYTDTTDQDISAWVALTSGTTPLVESDKTFVPRQDCTTTTNNLATTATLNIVAGDTVQFKGKWSGVDGSQIGIDVPNCDWADVPLTNNFTITPPQNLQVTFPSDPTGTINASIDSWSLNPNISGTPFTPSSVNDDVEYNNWNWKVELIDSLNSIVSVNEVASDNSLVQNLSVNTENIKANAAYRIRVTASNEYQATTTVISPVIYSKPSTPFIRRVVFTKNNDNTFNASVDWAKPRGGQGYDETITLNAGSYAQDEILAVVQNGVSASGNYIIENLPPATAITLNLTAGSTAGQNTATEVIYTPAILPTISVQWNDSRTCLEISASSPNVTSFNFTAGYTRGDDSLSSSQSTSQISLCNLNHGSSELVYVTATPVVGEHVYTEATASSVIEVLNPILGVSQDCNTPLNIVDIVETRQDGSITDRWQNGERVTIVPACA